MDFYRLPPSQHAQTCLKLVSHSQSKASSEMHGKTQCCHAVNENRKYLYGAESPVSIMLFPASVYSVTKIMFRVPG